MELYSKFLASTGVCTDTRSLKKGNLFFGLKGENFDGNLYAQAALDKGAIAAVVDDENLNGNGLIQVKDCLVALQELAKTHREKLKIPVIGLTGSNGKTTSKELLVAVLQQRYKVAFTRGNLNNHIGVPLSILSIDAKDEIAVIEMGANHQKEIEFLSGITKPNHGFITNFGKAHLEGFGGVEGVISGKSELYANLKSNSQIAWVNINDPIQLENSEGIKRYSFGESVYADYPVYGGKLNKQGQLSLRLADNTEVQTQLTGAYNFSNLAAAVALGSYFKLTNAQIKEGLEGYSPSNNRSQIENTQQNCLVKDYYNANPSSMGAALNNFDSLAGDHKWVILGDMLELGKDAEKEHKAISNLCQKLNLEKVILVGTHFKPVASLRQLAFANTGELVEYLNKVKPTNKTILIKGSRSMQLEKAAALL